MYFVVLSQNLLQLRKHLVEMSIVRKSLCTPALSTFSQLPLAAIPPGYMFNAVVFLFCYLR